MSSYNRTSTQRIFDVVLYANFDNNVKNFDSCFSWTKTDTGFVRGGWKVGYYDYIIVDEAQDFSRGDIEIFRKYARKALLLYGDSAQQLYKFNPEKEPLSMEEIQTNTEGVQEEILEAVQELFGSNFIYGVSFSKAIFS